MTKSTFAHKLSNCWHPIAYAHQVGTDQPYGTKLLDQHLVIWRTADGTPARCATCASIAAPHRRLDG